MTAVSHNRFLSAADPSDQRQAFSLDSYIDIMDAI